MSPLLDNRWVLRERSRVYGDAKRILQRTYIDCFFNERRLIFLKRTK